VPVKMVVKSIYFCIDLIRNAVAAPANLLHTYRKKGRFIPPADWLGLKGLIFEDLREPRLETVWPREAASPSRFTFLQYKMSNKGYVLKFLLPGLNKTIREKHFTRGK
jgi:hypothetical protein